MTDTNKRLSTTRSHNIPLPEKGEIYNAQNELGYRYL